jgi:outer membrane protein assembly factor BamB
MQLRDLLPTDEPDPSAPHLTAVSPSAALPGGRVEITGTALGPVADTLPTAFIGETPAAVALSRDSRAIVIVPEGAIASDLHLLHANHRSNGLPLRVAVPLIDTVHPVANPAVDADGNIFVMFSGPRGEKVDVSIFRVDRDFQVRPFVRDLLNVSSLAFDRDGFLYASSRAEGTVYRISPEGEITTFAEGMGIATGLAFDRDGNLFVGDRSGTIFKIGPTGSKTAGEIFVYATLEPSVAAYHLAFLDDGTLLVTAPTTDSHDVIYAIDPAGETTVFYRGLGRPQGLAVDVDGNVYVAASLAGRRGIIRIKSDSRSDELLSRNAELILAGDDLIGLAFLEDGLATLTTRSALFHVELGVEGRKLF